MKARKSPGGRQAVARTSSSPAPGKGNAAYKRYAGVVQRRRTTAAPTARSVHETAARGVQGPAAPLPHLDTLQPLFGEHDLSAVRAHADGTAAEAARDIGAQTYATGDDVAFDGAPDLHTAAHEAAHVVQQRGGVQLAGGAGAAGDSYERHADAVADRVVRGESAADLLGALAPRAAGRAAVQRKAIRVHGDPRAATDELQKILQSGTLEVVREAYAALRHARRDRPVPVVVDAVTFSAGGDSWNLELRDADTDAMIPVLARRIRDLEAAPETAGASDEWTAFAELFNREFRSVLHVFDLQAGPADTPAARAVVAARLQYLFTSSQREKLSDFCQTHRIPERLFNGDEVGRATAGQRIALAGHILGTGTYREGSFEQKLHAKMCYHFARLVWLYAGATPEGGQNTGVMGSFDHTGAAVFGGGSYETVMQAERDPDLDVPAGTAQARANGDTSYRTRMAPWTTVESLRPGDWLYVYNANRSRSGQHSVIFGGWLEDTRTVVHGPGDLRHYREARIFDQGSPDQGGREKTLLLGDDFFLADGRSVVPVTQIWRADAENAPVDDAAELSPELTRRIGKANEAFVKRLLRKHRGKQLDLDLFRAWLVTDNALRLGPLLATEGLLTPDQGAMLVEANGSAELHDLVCLSQRLDALGHNAAFLAQSRDAQLHGTERTDGVEDRHAAALREAEADKAEIEHKIADYLLEAMLAEMEALPLEAERAGIDRSGELAALRARVREVGAERDRAEDPAARADLAAERKQLIAEIRDLKAAMRASAREVRSLARAIARLEKRRDRALRRARIWQEKLGEVDDELPYATAHGGPIRRRDDRSRITGRYEDLHDGVPWVTFLVARE